MELRERSANKIEYADDFLPPVLNPNFWSTKKILDGRYEFVPSVHVPCGRALRVSVHRGDLAETTRINTTTERSELMEKKPDRIVPPGTTVWYAFSLYIPEDFNIADNRLVFAQWKEEHNDGSPGMALRYRNGALTLTIDRDAGRVAFTAPPITRGVWHRLMVSRRVAPDHQGHCEALFDGATFAMYDGEIGNTSVPVSAYFKMGVYRDRVDHVDTLYFASFRRGLSKEFCMI